MRKTLSSGFPTGSYPNQPARLQRLTRKLKFSLYMILSNKRIGADQTLQLRRLVCDFVVEDRFSQVDVQMMAKLYTTFNF